MQNMQRANDSATSRPNARSLLMGPKNDTTTYATTETNIYINRKAQKKTEVWEKITRKQENTVQHLLLCYTLTYHTST